MKTLKFLQTFTLLLLALLVLAGCNVAKETSTGNTTPPVVPVQNIFTVTVSNGTYNANQNINFNFSFPQNLTVDTSGGTPSIDFDLGGNTVTANYVSGSGTSTIVFQYLVQTGEVDSDGISLSGNISLNGGAISFGAESAPLTYSIPNTSLVLVDGDMPVINAVTFTNGTYYNGQSIFLDVEFSETVVVTGSPRLVVNIGGNVSYATYSSGSNSNTLRFNHVVSGTEYDLDGIVLASPIDLNGGSIKDLGNNNTDVTFIPPSLVGVLVDGEKPLLISVTAPSNGTYIYNQNLDFTVNYNENVNVTGFPRLLLDIGGNTVSANYVSGSGTSSLLFRYTVQLDEVDNDGIGLTASVDLNGGVIEDAGFHQAFNTFSALNTSAILVDGSVPDITGVTPPANNVYIAGQVLSFTVNWDTNVVVTGSPRLALDIGGVTKYATYSSGSGSSALVFSYTVLAGDNDNDGILLSSPVQLNGGSIASVAGANGNLTFLSPDLSLILVDTTPPTIISVTQTNGYYKAGTQVQFTVSFSESVAVTGTPGLNLSLTSGSVVASYISGSGTNALTFSYTVQNGDNDANGVDTVSPLDIIGDTIKDAAGNNADVTFTGTNYANVIVDTVAPTIAISTPVSATIINIASNSASYAITGTCSENGQNVIIKADGVNTTQASIICDGVNFSGTFSTTPLPQGTNNLTAEISDLATNSTVSSSVDIFKDTIAPTISSIQVNSADGLYTSGGSLSFNVIVSENVTIAGGTPTIGMTVGSSAQSMNVAIGSGTSFAMSFAVPNTLVDLDGVSVNSPLVLNAATIVDDVGNPMSVLSFTSPNTSKINIAPTTLETWLDAADTSTLFTDSACTTASTADQDSILCWKDKGFNAKHATQTNSNYAPKRLDNALAGQTGLEFDGVNDHFSNAHAHTVRTLFVVYKSNNTTSVHQVWGDVNFQKTLKLDGSNGRIILTGDGGISNNYDGKIYVYAGSSQASWAHQSGTGFWAASNHYLTRVDYRTSTNLVTQSIGVLDPASPTVGALDGEILEIILLDSTITVAIKTDIETYLVNKYGL